MARAQWWMALAGVSAVVLAAGCQVSVKTEERFVENTSQEASADWTGGEVVIDIQGVGISVNGGVTVTADPSAKRVSASARLLAMALPEEKSNAEKSLADAKATFRITQSGATTQVACDHGGTYGSSTSGKSGCEFVNIVVPAGTSAQPLTLRVQTGSGELTLNVASATLKSLTSSCNGSLTVADLPATKGATISIESTSDSIEAKLPSDFAADEIILVADADQIKLGPFSDIKNGAGKGGRGAPGTGLSSLRLVAEEFAGSTGSITLR